MAGYKQELSYWQLCFTPNDLAVLCMAIFYFGFLTLCHKRILAVKLVFYRFIVFVSLWFLS